MYSSFEVWSANKKNKVYYIFTLSVKPFQCGADFEQKIFQRLKCQWSLTLWCICRCNWWIIWCYLTDIDLWEIWFLPQYIWYQHSCILYVITHGRCNIIHGINEFEFEFEFALCCSKKAHAYQMQNSDPVLGWCRASITDGGPTLFTHYDVKRAELVLNVRIWKYCCVTGPV